MSYQSLVDLPERAKDGWIHFVWSVGIEGPWGPEAVTRVWIIEGHDRPIQVSYYFN